MGSCCERMDLPYRLDPRRLATHLGGEMMDPYYASNLATFYLGDARCVLPTLATGSADLVVTDPPYGANFRSGFKIETFGRIEGDQSIKSARELLDACTADMGRVLARFRHAYVFGLQLEHSRFAVKSELVWDKTDSGLGLGDMRSPWAAAWEPIFFHYNQQSAGTARHDGRLSARLRQGNVLSFQRLGGKGALRHPTEKPVPLLRALVEASSCPGEQILDPFAGVGSTLVAAILSGRRAIGIELDRDYADMAVSRIRDAERLAEQMERA